jgi:hypothetical protein
MMTEGLETYVTAYVSFVPYVVRLLIMKIFLATMARTQMEITNRIICKIKSGSGQFSKYSFLSENLHTPG